MNHIDPLIDFSLNRQAEKVLSVQEYGLPAQPARRPWRIGRAASTLAAVAVVAGILVIYAAR